MTDQEDNYAAILELNKSLSSADVIFFSELARVGKNVCTAGYLYIGSPYQ